jgi:hypothetical protein
MGINNQHAKKMRGTAFSVGQGGVGRVVCGPRKHWRGLAILSGGKRIERNGTIHDTGIQVCAADGRHLRDARGDAAWFQL